MFRVGGVQPGGGVVLHSAVQYAGSYLHRHALNRILDNDYRRGPVAWAVSYVFPRGWMQLWQERIEALKAR